jgi:hypothetical protein
MQWYAYDINTGVLKWGPSEAYTDAWGVYQESGATAAYGTLYAEAFDGKIHAYNITTGMHLWDFWIGDAGYETPYGTWPFYGYGSGITVADGKLYTGTSDHSPTVPLWRGGGLCCVNATTGDLVWKIKGWYWTPVIADGYMVVSNGADQRIYCFGKGPSATTVTASPKVSVHGNKVLVEGMVIDTATGTTQNEQAARFPNGVPAVSDDCMSAWMEYVYMQKPKPADITGVSVHLTAIDPNGNFQDIGYAVTDDLGNYAIDWAPPVPGTYKVTATFEGSESYYRSQAGTYFIVSETAVAEPATQTPAEASTPIGSTLTPVESVSPLPSEAPQPATTAGTPTLTYIAIGAVVILVVAAAAALILHRRK